MRTYIYFLFFLTLVTPLFVLSQKQQIKFQHLKTDDGLSQSNVLCILQDSRGFMWFGTRNGLNKYDGYTFTIYKNNVSDDNSLGNDRIGDMVEDADGSLWIATLSGGLDMFDWRKEKFIHYKHNPDDPAS